MKSLAQYISGSNVSYFYGIKPYRMIDHGSWSDPEITDGKKIVNYYEVEDSLYSVWKELKNEKEIDLSFDEWMKTPEAMDYTEEFFDGASATD